MTQHHTQYTGRDPGPVDWPQVEHVLLDMDGTLLDLGFDTRFWLDQLPACYASASGLTPAQALGRIRARMTSMTGRLGWYCIDEWSQALGVDLEALTRELAGGIRYRETAKPFLDALAASDKRALIVTNAHPATVAIKLERTGLDRYVEDIVSSHDFGAAKEHDEFWRTLRTQYRFNRSRTLFIDDNLTVLRAAQRFGIAHLLAISQPVSGDPPRDTEEFEAIQWFTEIMPIA